MTMAVRRVCRCGHPRGVHQHYRRGTDCATCDCRRYHRGYVVTVAVGTPMPAWVHGVAVSPYPDPSWPEVEPPARRAVGETTQGATGDR